MTLASQAAGVGLPEKRGQKAVEARSLSHSCSSVLLSKHAPIWPQRPLRAAGPRMRETPSAPAAVQGLLRYFHPSRVGRSRLAFAEKHLCARGTALWTHIRNLVCKGKVGRWVCHGFPGGPRRGRVPAPWMCCSVALLVGCIERRAQ